jgi:hypothetical protein
MVKLVILQQQKNDVAFVWYLRFTMNDLPNGPLPWCSSFKATFPKVSGEHVAQEMGW